MTQEQLAYSTCRGKWSQPGVPHKGWRCIGTIDLGEDDHEAREVCEMCECTEIRFVHEMAHDNFPEVLRVGCICAGHMESDLVSAERRDSDMRSRAAKRRRWLTRKWKRRGRTQSISADGYTVTVYPFDDHYAATVAGQGWWRRSQRHYATADAAKLAAFDVITHRLARRSRR